MGTAAVFSIDSQEDGSKRWKKGICMTSDGFLMNLRVIAESFMSEAATVRNFFGLYTQVYPIMEKIVADDQDDYLFIDDISNACWVSYSAQFNPFTKTITYYQGMFETPVMQYRYSRKKWVAESLNSDDILFVVDAVSRSRCLTEKIYAKNVDEARSLMQQFHMLGGGYNYVVTPVKVRAKVAA